MAVRNVKDTSLFVVSFALTYVASSAYVSAYKGLITIQILEMLGAPTLLSLVSENDRGT